MLALLILIAALGSGLAAAVGFAAFTRQRAAEDELLWVGEQYRQAIGRYVRAQPGLPRYPATLDELLLDPRFPTVTRHLRRPWRDPLIGGTDWRLIRAPSGGIMGIASLAQGAPIRRANFPEALGWVAPPETYREWVFVYRPTSAAR